MTGDFVVAIPARLRATRLPDKPLRMLAGRPLLAHVIERARASGAREVVVATDDARIALVAEQAGVRAVMTRADHASGTDRLAEVAMTLGWADDLNVVNLQGDEPLAPVSGIEAVAALLARSVAPVATLATAIEDASQLFDPNVVKVVRDARGHALYFSRAPIPWARDAFATAAGRAVLPAVGYLRHIGIYAYRAGFLSRYVALARTPHEIAESLEQLRVLEHGYPIAVGIAPEAFPAGVDTEADLARVAAILGAAR
ncbi:MAG TPA: 3-deoxy-manno-octulosonate cytidylyltransferase [Candidatus Saccharimonadia bacterium]|nr:3-deoxy-manno-octulosonate cytidylyltransferase [Candidatus Saccharimonadia bacterium]